MNPPPPKKKKTFLGPCEKLRKPTITFVRFLCPSFCLSVHPSVRPSICLSVCLSVLPSISLSVCGIIRTPDSPGRSESTKSKFMNITIDYSFVHKTRQVNPKMADTPLLSCTFCPPTSTCLSV